LKSKKYSNHAGLLRYVPPRNYPANRKNSFLKVKLKSSRQKRRECSAAFINGRSFPSFLSRAIDIAYQRRIVVGCSAYIKIKLKQEQVPALRIISGLAPVFLLCTKFTCFLLFPAFRELTEHRFSEFCFSCCFPFREVQKGWGVAFLF